ncbi:histidine phosphatase family protein [Pseudomonas fluorescens]|uniref:histidine phosphatase family protein n=1 Tax=Pseudomonas fluorescens TaxID=294 RepID=UPI001BE85178|nr:histidine phosphatase family protein [Pseudomonas fluorescens]MBT2374477.1 histidine phosphatase family protein [Pseudomonas fluorescens]
MQATRLTLICHASTPAQKRARFALDEPLEMAWQSAALSLAGRFKRTPRLLCGPEVRTRQTAMLFGQHPQVEEALRDCDVGRWQGKDLNELQQAEPDALQAWLTDCTAKPHGGESVAQLCERVGQWLHSLEQTPGHVLAVTHPFVIRAALLYVLQYPRAMFNRIDVEPLSSTELRFNGVWRLRLETHTT